MDVAAKRVNVFVYNNCSRDARVLKEAASLAQHGYEVKIVAVLDKVTVPFEERDGFEIHRVNRDSIHVKVINNVKSTFGLIQRILLVPFRIATKVFLFVRRALRYVLSGIGVITPDNQRTEWNDDNISASHVARILRNPHRFPVSDYVKALFYGTTLKAKFIGVALGLIGFPFYVLSRIVFLSINALQSWLIRVLKKLLMPYHRTSVFQDYYYKAAQFCEDYPADILHFHDLHTLPIIDELKDPRRMRFVYDSHELYTEIHTLTAKQKRKYKAIEKVKIKEVDHVITVNPSIAQELVQRYKVPEPTVVMNCPPAMKSVPQSSDLLRNRAGLPKEEVIILYQGGYSTGRGLEELIMAMEWVTEGTLVMMGWGRIEEDLHELARSKGVMDRIRFIPPAAQHEVLSYTCGADIGVIPYRAIGLNNYYTSPNKLFEYIQAHVVVAGSNFPELKRTISTYEIGELFDPEDPKSIAECLNRMAANRPQLEQYKKNILKAAEVFHWGNEEKKLVQIYKNLSEQHA